MIPKPVLCRLQRPSPLSGPTLGAVVDHAPAVLLSGKITFKNLKRVAKELGENLTDEEIQEMIDEADRSGAAVQFSVLSVTVPAFLPAICVLVCTSRCVNVEHQSHSAATSSSRRENCCTPRISLVVTVLCIAGTVMVRLMRRSSTAS